MYSLIAIQQFFNVAIVCLMYRTNNQLAREYPSHAARIVGSINHPYHSTHCTT
jgi:hypothetical protein